MNIEHVLLNQNTILSLRLFKMHAEDLGKMFTEHDLLIEAETGGDNFFTQKEQETSKIVKFLADELCIYDIEILLKYLFDEVKNHDEEFNTDFYNELRNKLCK